MIAAQSDFVKERVDVAEQPYGNIMSGNYIGKHNE